MLGVLMKLVPNVIGTETPLSSLLKLLCHDRGDRVAKSIRLENVFKATLEYKKATKLRSVILYSD